jgi:hypothetical protein
MIEEKMKNEKATKEYYDKVLNHGRFFEFYPTLTGDWEIDEVQWKFIQEHQFDLRVLLETGELKTENRK